MSKQLPSYPLYATLVSAAVAFTSFAALRQVAPRLGPIAALLVMGVALLSAARRAGRAAEGSRPTPLPPPSS